MGWEMPEHLAQPPMFRALDAYLNHPGKWVEHCTELLAGLKPVLDGDGLAKVLTDLGILKIERPVAQRWVDLISPYAQAIAVRCRTLIGSTAEGWKINEPAYLTKHWFASRQNDSCAFWGGNTGPVVEMVRQALIELATVRLEKGAPVASYWVCAGKDGDPYKDASSPGFRCYVAWTPAQITFLVLTPEEREADPELLNKPESLHHAPAKQPDTGLGAEHDAAISGDHSDRRPSGIVVIKPNGGMAEVVKRGYDLGR